MPSANVQFRYYWSRQARGSNTRRFSEENITAMRVFHTHILCNIHKIHMAIKVTLCHFRRFISWSICASKIFDELWILYVSMSFIWYVYSWIIKSRIFCFAVLYIFTDDVSSVSEMRFKSHILQLHVIFFWFLCHLEAFCDRSNLTCPIPLRQNKFEKFFPTSDV